MRYSPQEWRIKYTKANKEMHVKCLQTYRIVHLIGAHSLPAIKTWVNKGKHSQIAVSGHYADSVDDIVWYSWQWGTGCGGDFSRAWSDSDGVVDWSPTIVLWGLPLCSKHHIVLTLLLNSEGGCTRRGGKSCREAWIVPRTYIKGKAKGSI